MEHSIDIHFTQDNALEEAVRNLPPSSYSAKTLFDKWLESSACEDWCSAWDYLNSLDLKAYLRMYAELPTLLIKTRPVPDSPEDKLLRRYKLRYQAVAIWLRQLTSYDTPNNKEIYDSQELYDFRNLANIVLANLDLCRAIVRHPKSDKFNHIFYTPTYLWFWSEVASCIKYFKDSGLFEPINVEEIRTKHQIRREWGQLLSFYDVHGNKKIRTKNCKDLREFLDNIPAILPAESRKMLDQVDDTMLENALDNYIAAHHSYKNLVTNSEQYQSSVIYNDKSQRNKLFTTGAKQKRPKY